MNMLRQMRECSDRTARKAVQYFILPIAVATVIELIKMVLL